MGDLTIEAGKDTVMVAEEKKILTRDQIFAAKDEQRELVDVPEWGGAIAIWGMTGKQRGTFEAALTSTNTKNKQENWKRFRAAMLVNCCYDGMDDGANKVFRSQDVDALNDKSALVLDRLYQIAERLSGYKKKDVDEITKNSSGDQSEDFSFA